MLDRIYRYWNCTIIKYERLIAMRSPFSSNIYLMRYKIEYTIRGKRVYKIPRYRYIVDIRENKDR